MGGGHWMFLFAQNPLFRIATPPMFSVLVIYWVPDCCAYQIDKKMTECCPIFAVSQTWQKKSNTVKPEKNNNKNKIRHNTPGDKLTQFMCDWLLGRTTDLLEIRFFQVAFWSFSLNCRGVPIFYIVQEIILNLLSFMYFWPNTKKSAQQAVDF